MKTDPEIKEQLNKISNLLEYIAFILILQVGGADSVAEAWKIVKEQSMPSNSESEKVTRPARTILDRFLSFCKR